MQFKHLTIVGVGLIGGSLALAARKAGLAERITGWGGTRSLAEALARGAIDGVEEAFSSGEISSADLVYLAAPISGIIDFLRTRGRLVKLGALITDAGSTKREICQAARELLPPQVSFVGGHPMAGSHKAGVEFARADLFEGAPYAIVSEPQGEPGRVVADVARTLGANPVFMTADDHDRIVARVSHAPQLLSTALAIAAGRSLPDSASRLAGPGFSDMTRLSQSQWSVWEDICRTNADNIATALSEVTGEMDSIRCALESGDLEALRACFGAANELAAKLRQGREAEEV